jgi:mannose-6-phosphate isomerase-like protein (cupin superfamily)
MSEAYIGKLKSDTKHNHSFRRALFTGGHLQLVIMSLQPGEEIGTEVHEVDQLLYFVDGDGRVVLDGERVEVEKGMVVCIPAGVQHNVINANGDAMKLFTVYAPPEHAAGTVQETSEEADRSREPVGL